MTFNVELIGFFAAILTTIAFVPQVYQVWKSKSNSGLSLTTYMIDSISMIIANSITVFLSLIIIYFIIKSKKSN